VEHGGAGLPPEYEHAFREEEQAFRAPPTTDLVTVTLELVGPTILVHGDHHQRASFLPPILRGELLLVCQLFSEPSAGSDLASLRCRAERSEGGWLINGQKVWTSGARFADYGELIARTDPTGGHGRLTAFLLPMDSPGVEIRSIRQMTGGASFNEVFFTDVFIPDELRLGDVGHGWAVTLTTLGFERASSGSGTARTGGSFADALRVAATLGRTADRSCANAWPLCTRPRGPRSCSPPVWASWPDQGGSDSRVRCSSCSGSGT